MELTNEQLADELASRMTPKEILGLMIKADVKKQFSDEHVKRHALTGHKCPDFAAFCNHMLDGGGVRSHMDKLPSGKTLIDSVHDALVNKDEEAFWHLFPHLFKAVLQDAGKRRKLGNGGVSSQFGMNKIPPTGGHMTP